MNRLGTILICTMALVGCSPTSNKDTNHHITKTEHVKKHKNHHITKTEHVKKHKNHHITKTEHVKKHKNHHITKTEHVKKHKNVNKTTASLSKASSAATSAPAQTTSGFNVNGHHFDIGSFSGTGLVPTDKVYQWSSLSGWYLIDINSVAARYTSSLGVGSPVTVNGRTYHVTHVLYNQPNNGATLRTVKSMLGSNAIGWQTCTSERYLSNLNLWFAN